MGMCCVKLLHGHPGQLMCDGSGPLCSADCAPCNQHTTACKVERKGGEENVAKATYLLAYIFVFKIHLFEITGHNDKDNLCCVDD